MESEHLILMVAILSIAAIIIVALCRGVDSIVTGSGCGLIGAIAGYIGRNLHRKRKEKDGK